MRYAIPLLAVLGAACSSAAPPITDGYVGVDGAQLYYEESGVGSPVILIHGGFLDRRMWDAQFEFLARHFRTIRYDVRAHGLSRADSGKTFVDHEDLHGLMEELALEKAVIIGLSMGGQIAIDFALAYPERVEGLVLVGPGLSGFDSYSDELNDYINELTAAAETNEFSQIIETFARWWCDGPHRESSQVDSLVRNRVLEMLNGSEQRWQLSPLTEYLNPPATEWLHQIRAPTLAIVGSIDMPDIHNVVDMIVDQVPGASRVEIPDVAHMVNMEAPGEFNEIVLEFLEGLEGR